MSFETPSALANSIMASLYDVLTSGDNNVPASEDNFFSWTSPGMPIEADDFDFLSQGLTGLVNKSAVEDLGTETEAPEITPELLDQLRATDTARLYMQAESFARMVDFVPDLAKLNNEQFTRLSVMNNEGTLSERYEYVLRMSQVMQSELPADIKQRIEQFRGLLNVTRTETDLFGREREITEDGPIVKLYQEKMANYEAAALEYNNRRIAALAASRPEDVHYWAMNANILRNRVRAAMADWVSNGYKNDYEQINAFIDQVMQRDMSLLKDQYRDDLLKAKLTSLASGSDFYFTSVVPGNFTRASGWTQFTFNSARYNRYRNSKYASQSSSTKAGGGFSLGFLTVGGGGGGSNASSSYESKVKFDSTRFRLSFKIAQVMVTRPWFKTAFLNSKTWRFDQNNPDSKSQMVSDGGNPAKGLIPAYPTSMVVIKDLELSLGQSSGFSDYLSEYERSSASGGGALSLGPFNLGGSHKRSTSLGETTFKHGYSFDGQTMKVPGMQVIGFKCHVLPKSPNPLPNIEKWI
ncbi:MULTISPECIES: hypothetical protein [Cyanophyceae]|uniref:Uncharacterized protein n=1 Tax=Leptolyngbya subtilissima DQ-A4 TaxID=2933933 RepID=A0ABV0KAJ8_9CYAN|nr:hypothetical protein [Nodosilinea sp. FACHB-141]MBD2115014.1 hypothetical protein [Nodosilinea sp. FACHB-141]